MFLSDSLSMYIHIILFYRDDRMVETEHLGLCEVVVTPTPGRTKNKSLRRQACVIVCMS